MKTQQVFYQQQGHKKFILYFLLVVESQFLT